MELYVYALLAQRKKGLASAAKQGLRCFNSHYHPKVVRAAEKNGALESLHKM